MPKFLLQRCLLITDQVHCKVYGDNQSIIFLLLKTICYGYLYKSNHQGDSKEFTQSIIKCHRGLEKLMDSKVPPHSCKLVNPLKGFLLRFNVSSQQFFGHVGTDPLKGLSWPSKSDYVGPSLHVSLSCLFRQCCIAGLEVSFISISGKSPTKSEVTFQHDHSKLLFKHQNEHNATLSGLLFFLPFIIHFQTRFTLGEMSTQVFPSLHFHL